MIKITETKTALITAVLLHVVLFIALIWQWHFASDEPASQENAPIIQAFTISEPTPKTPQPPEIKPEEPMPIEEPPEPIVQPVKEEVVKKEVVEPEVKETKVTKKMPEPVKKVTEAATPPAKPTVATPAHAPTPPAAPAMSMATKRDIDRYSGLIKAAIARYWFVPPNLDKNLTAVIVVRVAPGGIVLDTQVLKTSGNASLDQSALAAINKASPLPVPEDPDLFDQFRELRLTVRPEGVISNV